MCAGYGSEVFYATVGEKSPVLSPKAGGDGGILSSFFRKFHTRCHFLAVCAGGAVVEVEVV